jgi:hypothetical protein
MRQTRCRRQVHHLGLTPQQNTFIELLGWELNKQGFPIEYAAFKTIIANLWLGNAYMRIPEDNQELAIVLSEALASWRAAPVLPGMLPGFLITSLRRYGARHNDEVEQAKPVDDSRKGTGQIGDQLRVWTRH